MRFFSKISEYAIRALIVMSREKGWRIHVKTICEIDDLPVHFTRKALQSLIRYKIVEANRGPQGGYILKLPPEKIFLYDIINIFEPLEKPKECLIGSNHCSANKPCLLRQSWFKAEKKLQETLKKLSIKDLTTKSFT